MRAGEATMSDTEAGSQLHSVCFVEQGVSHTLTTYKIPGIHR